MHHARVMDLHQTRVTIPKSIGFITTGNTYTGQYMCDNWSRVWSIQRFEANAAAVIKRVGIVILNNFFNRGFAIVFQLRSQFFVGNHFIPVAQTGARMFMNILIFVLSFYHLYRFRSPEKNVESLQMSACWLDILPDDLSEIIYRYVHSSKFTHVVKDMKELVDYEYYEEAGVSELIMLSRHRVHPRKAKGMKQIVPFVKQGLSVTYSLEPDYTSRLLKVFNWTHIMFDDSYEGSIRHLSWPPDQHHQHHQHHTTQNNQQAQIKVGVKAGFRITYKD